MSVKPKVVNGFSWTFVCKMGAGPSTNLYSIGGGPLTQLNFVILIFFEFFFIHKKRWQWENERKIFCWWPTDPHAFKRTFQPKHSTSVHQKHLQLTSLRFLTSAGKKCLH